MQLWVDVRANLRHIRLLAVVAALLSLATAAGADDAPPLLTIGDIVALPVADLQAGRAARVRGVVTLARGNYVVEDDTGGIYAHHIDAASRTGGSSAPGPPGSHDGRLVRCTGQVLGTLETADGTILSLIDGGKTLDAVLPATSGRHASRFTPGTEVAVTGILQLDLAAPGSGDRIALNPPVERISLLLCGPEDVAVIRPAPWWTPARLAAVLGVVAAVLGGTLLWIGGLRRQVRAQARQIAVEMQSRRAAALEFDATLRDRNRLAANLHDTLLQTLDGIGYHLDACEGSRDRDADDARRPQGFADGTFGIQGMREPAARLGGTVAIDSRVGGGTTVRATVRRHEFDPYLAADQSDP